MAGPGDTEQIAIGDPQEEKILYDVLEFCKWPETVTSVVRH